MRRRAPRCNGAGRSRLSLAFDRADDDPGAPGSRDLRRVRVRTSRSSRITASSGRAGRRVSSARTADGHAGRRWTDSNARRRAHPRLGCVPLRVQRASSSPCERGATDDLPGMNVSYDAAGGRRDRGPPAGRASGSRGCTPACVSAASSCYCEPDAVIEHEMDFGIRDFIAQRFHYARAHAAMRNPELGSRRAVYFCRLASAHPAAATGVIAPQRLPQAPVSVGVRASVAAAPALRRRDRNR